MKRTLLSFVLVVGALFFITNAASSQNQIFINDSAHLVQSGNVYEAEVLTISRMKAGFGFFLKVNIGENQNAYCFLVSNKTSAEFINKKKCLPIKKGEKMQLLLVDYFQSELVLSIEYKRIYDVLLGEEKVAVPAGIYGFGFSRIFVSPNVMNRYYCKDIFQNSIFQESSNIPKELYATILQFISSMSFEKEFENVSVYVDTMRLKNSLLSSSFPYLVVSPGHTYNARKNFAHKKTFKKMDWESYGIRTDNFIDFFKGVLREKLKLPLEDYDEGYSLNVTSCRVLFRNGIFFTIEVQWAIKHVQYSVVLSFIEENDSFKIIGMSFM